MSHRNSLATVAVAIALVLAGCTVGKPTGSTPTSTQSPTVETTPATPGADRTVLNTTALRRSATDVTDGAQTYRAIVEQTVRYQYSAGKGSGTDSQRSVARYRVDRTAPAAAYSAVGTNVTIYALGDAIYRYRSGANGNSEWTVLSQNHTTAYRINDPLYDVGVMLGNGTVTQTARTTLGDRDVVQMDLAVDHAAYNRTTRGNVTGASLTVWVAPESGRIHRAVTVVNRSQTVGGVTAYSSTSRRMNFTYTNVTISLPRDPSEAEPYERPSRNGSSGQDEETSLRTSSRNPLTNLRTPATQHSDPSIPLSRRPRTESIRVTP